jgi:hypothetical protein
MSADVQTGRLIPYLVEMFRYQAWLGLGKIANPISGTVERDLNMAKAMIDLLGELEERTEGHRSQDETLLVQGTVTDLRLNYVDEMRKPEAKPADRTEESSGESAKKKGCGDGDCGCGDTCEDDDCDCDCEGDADANPKS